jgi:hypothetical protein
MDGSPGMAFSTVRDQGQDQVDLPVRFRAARQTSATVRATRDGKVDAVSQSQPDGTSCAQ